VSSTGPIPSALNFIQYLNFDTLACAIVIFQLPDFRLFLVLRLKSYSTVNERLIESIQL